jgi:hypothetical protein
MIKRGVMMRQGSLQSQTIPMLEEPKFVPNKLTTQGVTVISPGLGNTDIVGNSAGEDKTDCICLNLEDLKCFETVEGQYENLGVIFENCIALQPSNPAFPAHSGLTVLMGGPKSGLLEAKFIRPVTQVSAYVTSSQRLIFSAYGKNKELLAQTVLPGENLGNSDSVIPPNTKLSLSAQDIHRVSFCAFDGQFTVDDFSFSL